MSHKSWIATLNNYTDKDVEWFPTLEGVTRMRMVKEVGDKCGTPHLHVYITFRKTYTLRSLKKLHSKCNWSKASANEMFGLNYTNKIDSEIVYDEDKGKQGKRNDLEEAIENLKLGGLDEVAESNPVAFVKYHRGLDALRQRLVKRKTYYETEVIYIWSEEKGIGKSRMAREIDPLLYNVTEPNNDGKVWFDGYEGEETILLDDFYSWIKYSLILQYLDVYPMRVFTKGSSVKREWTRVIITSNVPPEEQYQGVLDIEAYLRRISKVTHMYTDENGSTQIETKTEVDKR